MKNDVTLLIQGKYSNTILNNINNYFPYFNKIIYSTWQNNDIELNGRIEFVINDLPDVRNKYNVGSVYYQCKSTLNGLEKVQTKYVLKHRTDEYVSNINLFLNYFKGKFLCCNYAAMKISHLPYHVSDHLFLAETEKLYNVFFNLEKYLSYESKDEYCVLNPKFGAEMLISMNYITTFGKYSMSYLINNLSDKDIVFSIMKEYFDVYDINNLKPFKMMHNHRNVSYVDYNPDDLYYGVRNIDDFIK